MKKVIAILLTALMVTPLYSQELVCNMAHAPRNVQAPNVAADFWTQWESVNPRMALFVLITPQSFWTSVNPVGITSNTRDMTLPGHPGVTFKSSPGITPTVVEQLLDDATNLEMTGIYQSGIFESDDVLAGKWNFAEIEVFSACWNDTDLGELLHFKGKLGEVKDYGYYFTAEARGLISLLSQEIAPVTTRFCRVKEFGDTQCGKSLAGTYTINGTNYLITQTAVTGIGSTSGSDTERSAIVFDTSAWDAPVPLFADLEPYMAQFANGKLTAIDGPNAGVSREIVAVVEATGGHPFVIVHLKRAFPFAVDVNTSFNIVMGCNRTIEACIGYSNIVNRRAEDWIPTIESANRVPPSN